MFLLFFLLWVLLNGKLNAEIALFGLVISGAVYFFICRYMGYSPEADKKIAKNLFKGLFYAAVVIKEFIICNIQVSRIILSPKKEIKPRIVTFRTDLKSPLSKVALCNSITLTPGTITVGVKDDEIKVHCLTASMAEGIGESVFVRMLRKIERE